MYYLSKVKFENVDSATGKIKKITEQYLVDAESISDAERKMHEKFKDSIADFTVIGVQESPIMGIVK
jgi:hypothetical protein